MAILSRLLARLLRTPRAQPPTLDVRDPPLVLPAAGDCPAESVAARARRLGVDEMLIDDWAAWRERTRR